MAKRLRPVQIKFFVTEEEKELTEEMKNTDPLRWVGMMNNYKSCAEEVIFSELIYV